MLVVEDDPALRDLYRSALTSAGYTVVAVEDGVDALRRIDGSTPAAVVLDLALPRLNGYDVTRELKSRPDTRHIPIVIVSGTDPRGLDSSDFACVLRKPVDPEAVVIAVDRCLKGRAV